VLKLYLVAFLIDFFFFQQYSFYNPKYYFLRIKWSERHDSNMHCSAPKADASPLGYSPKLARIPKFMTLRLRVILVVRLEGVEPSLNGLKVRCASH
jgi:hypothetical protein